MTEPLVALYADTKSWSRIVRIARRLVWHNEEEADDVIQSALVTILACGVPLPTVREELVKWITQVIQWEVANRRKRYARETACLPVESLSPYLDNEERVGHPLDNSYLGLVDRVAMREALGALPVATRNLIWERVVEGKEWVETTLGKQGWHRKTLWRWYHKGLVQLRGRLVSQ